MEKKWSNEVAVMEFPVQRWLSVDEDDGDVVREVAAQLPATDKQPGIKCTSTILIPFRPHRSSSKIRAYSQVDSAFYLPRDGKMSTSQRAVMLCGWGVKAGMV